MFFKRSFCSYLLIVIGLYFIFRFFLYNNKMTSKKYIIHQTWDGNIPLDKAEIKLNFLSTRSTNAEGLLLSIDAPLYNDPKIPENIPVGSMDKLWDFEVVEVFFLADDNKYLEVELSPSGHYLILKLDGHRNIVEVGLPLKNYTTSVSDGGTRWQGEALIPWNYFPAADVTKFNAYAIHNSDPNRVYMALFPTPSGKFKQPDFHRLEYFQSIDLS